jgi:hypothetical protein
MFDLSLLLVLLALPFATAYLLLAWFKGSIFAGRRAYFEALALNPTWWQALPGRLMGCPLCLSAWLTLALFVLHGLLSPGADALVMLSIGVVWVPSSALGGLVLYEAFANKF